MIFWLWNSWSGMSLNTLHMHFIGYFLVYCKAKKHLKECSVVIGTTVSRAKQYINQKKILFLTQLGTSRLSPAWTRITYETCFLKHVEGNIYRVSVNWQGSIRILPWLSFYNNKQRALLLKMSFENINVTICFQTIYLIIDMLDCSKNENVFCDSPSPVFPIVNLLSKKGGYLKTGVGLVKYPHGRQFSI